MTSLPAKKRNNKKATIKSVIDVMSKYSNTFIDLSSALNWHARRRWRKKKCHNQNASKSRYSVVNFYDIWPLSIFGSFYYGKKWFDRHRSQNAWRVLQPFSAKSNDQCLFIRCFNMWFNVSFFFVSLFQTVINAAYCCLILLGKSIQKLVFGELRISEQQHLKDKFWNFVFYKFIFVFGVVNVQFLHEVSSIHIFGKRIFMWKKKHRKSATLCPCLFEFLWMTDAFIDSGAFTPMKRS